MEIHAMRGTHFPAPFTAPAPSLDKSLLRQTALPQTVGFSAQIACKGMSHQMSDDRCLFHKTLVPRISLWGFGFSFLSF
jgi:hypothetical protein